MYAILADTATSAIATAVGDATTAISGTFSTITGWWFVPVAIAFFVASLAVGLIARFFGKRKGRRGKK